MPNVLVAPKTPARGDAGPVEGAGGGDGGEGYYDDGAYAAVAFTAVGRGVESDGCGGEDGDLDPQESYYGSLSTRFLDLRSHLHSPPPPPPPLPQPASSPSSSSSSSSSVALVPPVLTQATTHAKWRYSLLHTRPTMRQLAGMRQETVMRGLRVLESVITVGNLGREGAGVGVWAWGLLAKCRGREEMGSLDVGVLREVGKRAAWVLRGLRGGRGEGMGRGDGDADGDEEGVGDGDGEVQVDGDGNGDGDGEDGNAGVEEQEQEGREEDGDENEDGDGGAEVRDAEAEDGDGEGHDADFQLPGTEQVPDENPTHPVVPQSEDVPALALAKHSLLSTLPPPAPSPSPSPSRTPTEDSSPPLPPPGNSLSTPTPANAIDPILPVSKEKEKEMDDPAATTLSACAHTHTHARTHTHTHTRVGRRDELDVYATLDMIITVVGEFYGQRDLLEGRDLWDEVF